MSRKNNKLQKTFIYGLREAGTDNIRYIGKADDLHRRYLEHLSESKRYNKTHKHKWINSILKKGGQVELIKLEEIYQSQWQKREKIWIKKIGLKNLTNHLNGGEGGSAKKEWLSYEKAKKYVHKLNIKNKRDWIKFKKPKNIPKYPEKTYEKEWEGYGAWLGTSRKSNIVISSEFIDFENAKKIISNFNIRNINEWIIFCASKNKPKNIPSNPQKIYKNIGWSGWNDWLSNKKFSDKNKLPYEQAKKIVHKLNLITMKDWQKYCKLNKPTNIPFNPCRTYEKDWKGWRDWLGTSLNSYITLEEAKKIVNGLNLKSKDEWFKFHSKNKIKKIPKQPNAYYKDWINWYDFLGKN